ncbi:hypothetical protein [Shewanella sp. YIC-542]|uniref:hypothetical protein n=1 Tax=Shewanella mytili TaxID=3377111 RepID=UPI00398E5074
MTLLTPLLLLTALTHFFSFPQPLHQRADTARLLPFYPLSLRFTQALNANKRLPPSFVFPTFIYGKLLMALYVRLDISAALERLKSPPL